MCGHQVLNPIVSDRCLVHHSVRGKCSTTINTQPQQKQRHPAMSRWPHLTRRWKVLVCCLHRSTNAVTNAWSMFIVPRRDTSYRLALMTYEITRLYMTHLTVWQWYLILRKPRLFPSHMAIDRCWCYKYNTLPLSLSGDKQYDSWYAICIQINLYIYLNHLFT